MRRRNGELSALFKRLYEDNVLGRVTNEQFRMLSADYNEEQKELESAIPAKEEQLERLKASVAHVDAFIEKAKQYTAIDELTPQLLRLFIQRIEIGERTKKHSRSAGQSVRIVAQPGVAALRGDGGSGVLGRPLESRPGGQVHSQQYQSRKDHNNDREENGRLDHRVPPGVPPEAIQMFQDDHSPL